MVFWSRLARVPLAAALVATALALGGCMVETDTFLSERGAEPPDDRLLGAWSLVEGEQTALGVMLVRAEDDGTLGLLSVEVREDYDSGEQSVDWNLARAWTTRVGGDGYMNLDLDGEKMILAYGVNNDGNVRIGVLDEARIRAAIEEGRLEGTVAEGTFLDTVRVTASRQAFVQFLETEGGHVLFDFGDDQSQLVFRRHRFRAH